MTLKIKYVVVPGGHVKKQSFRLKPAAVSFKPRVTHQILQRKLSAAKILKWKPEIALALAIGVIHADEKSMSALLPRISDKRV